ncbi:MAG: colicin Z C-terminal domain-related protein [Alphaproteobacteria bacterium]
MACFFFKLQLNKSKSASVYAPPFIWGPWMPVAPLGLTGKAHTFTLSYGTISQAPSSFDIEISYAGNTVRRVGPGAYRSSVPANSINELKVRAKSHSFGQILLVTMSD